MTDAEMLRWEDDPLWYKDAVIYQLHVRAFFDSSGDGTGDFQGLTQKLDYVRDLGVNTLWLLPFYPSPQKDDGYDISDYRNIHSDYGTRRDFRHFVRAAHQRGLKVITELVINHTSDQHPWFQAARQAPPGSPKRDFYVWSDSDQKFPETRIIFTDTEQSNWAWDPVAQAYYWHRFFSHQPDLNHNNPHVVQAVIRIMRFWMDQGVDGVRLDAIPYLCVREGTTNENLPETHAVIRKMRSVVDAHYQGRMFLAEANQWPEDVRDYFGDGDECHMAYHFPLMPRMYMAIAEEDRHPIIEIMDQTPEIPDTCQWAVFLRNHDELTLEMVTDRERDYMYRYYASDRRMRVNVGIRRRLAPLMDNDPDRIKLMNSLLFSIIGSPILYYGDEIGMGDNIFLGDRNGVRTPMQWSPDRNAGFSRADPQRLYLPPIMDPIYGYEAVNVEAQSRDPASLLNWMKRMIAIRKNYRAFSRGTLHFLHPGNRKILAYLREHAAEVILCVVNLSRHAQPVELDLSRFKGWVPVEMFGQSPFPPIGELPYLLTLSGYGVYWFRLLEEGQAPQWHTEIHAPVELLTLVLTQGMESFFPEQLQGSQRTAALTLRRQIDGQIAGKFLENQRWYGDKGKDVEHLEVMPLLPWHHEWGDWLFAAVDVRCHDATAHRYFMPLAIVWGEDDETLRALLHATLARVRQRARVGVLCDALADETFLRTVVDAIGREQTLSRGAAGLQCTATAVYTDLVPDNLTELAVRRAAEGSNSAVILGDQLFLKAYRRLQPGINPEFEMGRFLTEQTGFGHIIPVAGAVEYRAENGEVSTLFILQGYVDNQGDAWTYTLNYLERYLEACLINPPAEPAENEDSAHAPYLSLVHLLGIRTAELHRALARTTGDDAFDPEPVQPADVQAWVARTADDAQRTLARLEAHAAFNTTQRADLELILAQRHRLNERIEAVARRPTKAIKTRHHGDYHLGQVLVASNDFVIIDFEGEPARPLAERRAKQSALRDVAGMLRSFSYAAYSALERLSSAHPQSLERLEPYARDWETRTAQAFLTGYRDTIAGCPVYPAEHAEELLALFVLEKVLYELNYELDNRPDWVGIPMRGLLELIGAGTAMPL